MIKDRLTNAKVYYNLSDNMQKGLAWLEKTNLNSIENGKYEIDGDKVYASVQTYETKERIKFYYSVLLWKLWLGRRVLLSLWYKTS